MLKKDITTLIWQVDSPEKLRSAASAKGSLTGLRVEWVPSH